MNITQAGEHSSFDDNFANYMKPDSLTGLALAGYDPVSYHTDKIARVGDKAYESEYGGVLWRFVSEGNLKAFENDASNYIPYFSGYDPFLLSQGFLTQANPDIWAIYKGRLFLFYKAENRENFANHPDIILKSAQQNWSELIKPADVN